MNVVEKALSLKTDLDNLRPFNADDEKRIMQKFRLDWNYHSNHLEGNSLSFGETKALILFGITAQGKPLKDHFEITGHDEAIKWVIEVIKQERPLTETFIRELHKLLLKESYEVKAITSDGQPTKKRVEVGKYKSTPNHVKTKTGEIFRFATPEETPALMNDLINWYRTEKEDDEVNPIMLASQFHYKFIRIHPFDDGNGRTARILMNFVLMQFGFPPVVIKTEDKENYFAALRQADAGVFEPFLNYIAKNLIDSLELMIKGAQGKSVEDPDDIDKEIRLLQQKLKGLSQPITISKSEQSVLDLFDNSLVPLFTKYIEKAEKLEEFYVDSDFHIYVNNTTRTGSKEKALSVAREMITGETPSINSVFKYEGFNHKGFGNINYESAINCSLEFTGVKISNRNHSHTIEKLYSEELNENEIIEIVNAEIKDHRNFIEKQILKISKAQ